MRDWRCFGVRFFGVLLVCTAVLWPLSGQAADYLANGRLALQRGELKTAQIQLLNAVKADPQNAEARYLLARVEFDLGDAVAAEGEVRAARDRGYDAHKTFQLLTQAMLAQAKYQAMLDEFKPSGKDNQLELRDPRRPRHCRSGSEQCRRRREGIRGVGSARADLGAGAAGRRQAGGHPARRGSRRAEGRCGARDPAEIG